jgi:hypothetical protein
MHAVLSALAVCRVAPPASSRASSGFAAPPCRLVTAIAHLRSVLRIARLANYELSWRLRDRAGMTMTRGRLRRIRAARQAALQLA